VAQKANLSFFVNKNKYKSNKLSYKVFFVKKHPEAKL